MDKPVNFDARCRRRSALRRALDDFCKKYQGVERVSVGLPMALDRLSRHFDRAIGRSYNGVWQRLFMDGHSVVPMLFMLMAIGYSVLGPTPRFRGWPAVSGILAAVAVYWLFVRYVLAKCTNGRGLLTFQIAVLGVLFAVFWLPAGGKPELVEATQAPYRNLFAPIMLLLLALAVVSNWVASLVVRGFPDADRALFAELLKKTELFREPVPPEPTPHRFFHGFINAPLYHPLHLLLLPALPLITLPPQYLTLVGGLLFIFAWLLLTFAGMYERLNLMIRVVRNLFLIGGQLAVSLVIIGLATARLLEIDYVTTLLDSASAKVVLYYVFAAYTAFWLYEYWINRALSERMLPMLRPAHGTPVRMNCIDYKVDGGIELTKVKEGNRAVEVFSGGRFAVTGEYLDKDSGTPCAYWTPYEKTELFERLAQSATPNMKYQANVAAAEIDKRTKLYFNVMNLLLAFILGAAGWLLHHFNPQRAEASGYGIGAARAAAQPVSLGELIFDHRRVGNKVILLAASGGGTRAALYTASALRGIAALGRLDDVVLVSGVSGGSAALAYFALHRDELSKQAPGPCTEIELKDVEKRIESGDTAGADVWCVFMAAMARPYIDDVLRGASEVDVAMGKSFGHLLDESFMRSFGVVTGAPVTLDTITSLGLILNTTLAGHPAGDSAWLGSLYHVAPDARLRYSVNAGGRLIFTNLREVGAFPGPAQALPYASDGYFPYVIVGGKATSITAAAALSANFPPVFSNGGVDVRAGPENTSKARRYWVTDGGAADNRGIISLLYAVHSMLDECKNRPEWKCREDPPEIHIIVADASAVTIDYRSDRGFGSLSGAANKFASQLMLELVTSAEHKYALNEKGRILTHYLPMPAVLRTRGGLGTHWMMPQKAVFTDICEPDRKLAKKLTVDRLQLLEMMVDLHAPSAVSPPLKATDCQLPRPDEAREWLAADRHARAWSEIVVALGAR